MRKHGWDVWFCPEAEIIHFGGQSSDQVWNYTEKNTIILNNCYQAMEKHRGRFYVKILQIITLAISSVELFFSKIRHRERMTKFYRSLVKYHFKKLKGDTAQATTR